MARARNRIKLVKGNAFSIAFHNVRLPIVVEGEGVEKIEITEEDRLDFSITRTDRVPVIQKYYPGEIERNGDTFYAMLTAEETERLESILYRAQLRVDISNCGEEVYTLVDKELEVVAK